jgi:hypothetical protein
MRSETVLRATIVLAAWAISACGPPPAGAVRPGMQLASDRDAESEGVSLTGALRRSIEPFRDLWVVVDVVEPSDLRGISLTTRRERVRYTPKVGRAFDRVEEREFPAAPRVVECAVLELPGARLTGHVVQVRVGGHGHYAGRVVVEVDNTSRAILPGMHVALAVRTDREPVVLTGLAELPRPPAAAADPPPG